MEAAGNTIRDAFLPGSRHFPPSHHYRCVTTVTQTLDLVDESPSAARSPPLAPACPAAASRGCRETHRASTPTTAPETSRTSDSAQARRESSHHRDSAPGWVADAYRRYVRPTRTLVRRLGVPASEVDDVVQEIFVVLHRRRNEFRHHSGVQTWLYGIALRVAPRHRLRARRGKTVPLPTDARSPAPSMESRLGAQLQLERLDILLGELPDTQREVFVLVELAGVSAPEVARLCGAKLNTVYSRLRLARSRMTAPFDLTQSATGRSYRLFRLGR